MSQYRFTEDAFVGQRFYQAGDIASTADVGGSLPAGWVPSANVDPLDTAAVNAFWAAGPQPLGVVRNQWTGVSVADPVTRWVATPLGEFQQWSLTGLGASLGVWGVLGGLPVP